MCVAIWQLCPLLVTNYFFWKQQHTIFLSLTYTLYISTHYVWLLWLKFMNIYCSFRFALIKYEERQLARRSERIPSCSAKQPHPIYKGCYPNRYWAWEGGRVGGWSLVWTVKRGADSQTPGWVSNIVVEEYLSQAESLKVVESSLNLSFGMNKT